jgi:hypothetical protein
MLGRFMNGKPSPLQRAMAALPNDQQLALQSVVDRSSALSSLPTKELIKMYTDTVRAVYAASEDSEQREAMLEVCALGLAISARLSN